MGAQLKGLAWRGAGSGQEFDREEGLCSFLKKRTKKLSPLFLGALALSASAAAQKPDPPGLADACTGCHGVDGRSRGYIPSIGGTDKAALFSALQSFRDPKSAATIMNRIVRGYSDPELAALAAYFSAVKPP